MVARELSDLRFGCEVVPGDFQAFLAGQRSDDLLALPDSAIGGAVIVDQISDKAGVVGQSKQIGRAGIKVRLRFEAAVELRRLTGEQKQGLRNRRTRKRLHFERRSAQ